MKSLGQHTQQGWKWQKGVLTPHSGHFPPCPSMFCGLSLTFFIFLQSQRVWCIIMYHLSGASQVVLMVKKPPAGAEYIKDVASIPGSGRSPGGGHGHPLQYSCLENPMGRGAWSAMVHRVTNRETCLKPWIIVSVDKTISLRPGTGRTPFTWKIYSLLSGAQRGQHVLLASAVSQVPLIQNNPPKWYIWDGVFCCPQVHSLVTAPDIQTV